jgi:hypothetical protein
MHEKSNNYANFGTKIENFFERLSGAQMASLAKPL